MTPAGGVQPGRAPDTRRELLALAGAALLVAFVLPSIAQWLIPAMAVAMSVRGQLAGRPTVTLELAVWSYFTAPFLRRVADWQSGFHELSPILLTGPLVCLSGLVALRHTRRVRGWVVMALATVALCFLYAAGTGVLFNGLVASGTQFAQWFSPLAVGALVLLSPGEPRDWLGALHRTARWGLLTLGGYGIVQFVALPPWDATWMRNVSDVVYSIGAPQALEVRVFSLAASPGPAAGAIVGLLALLIATKKRPIDVVAILLSLCTLGLTQVRAAWLSLAVVVVVLLFVRGARVVSFAAALVALLAVLLVAGGPVTTTILDRVQATTTAGQADDSYQARTSFQVMQLPAALRNAAGDGLGSSGTAVRTASSDASNADFANTDSGYLEELRVFGSVAGLLVLAITIGGTLRAWAFALRLPREEEGLRYVGLIAACVVLPVNLLFGPGLTDVAAVLSWTGFALAGIWGVDSRRLPARLELLMSK